MTEKTVHSTIEILGKVYPVKCQESELDSLQKAAQYLNDKMAEVQESGKVVDPGRIAIITALNIAHQMLQSDQQKTSFVSKLNQRITNLQDRLDTAINKALQTEFLYSAE